jgi:hypothetical protein
MTKSVVEQEQLCFSIESATVAVVLASIVRTKVLVLLHEN